ncbi:MAG: hypothetical protein ACHP8A_20370 [Terriglobales bacterium]
MASEAAMECAVASWLERRSVKVARQVRLDNMRFDVVAYDKERGVFNVVECKPASGHTDIGKALGQLSAYRDKIRNKPDEFVDSVSEKISMRFGRWMEATNCGRRIRITFHAALTDKALKDISRIRDFKEQYPHFGIIRYRKDGSVRGYIREGQEINRELARATMIEIALRSPWAAPKVGGTR